MEQVIRLTHLYVKGRAILVFKNPERRSKRQMAPYLVHVAYLYHVMNQSCQIHPQ